MLTKKKRKNIDADVVTDNESNYFSIIENEEGEKCVLIDKKSKLFKAIDEIIADEYGDESSKLMAHRSTLAFYHSNYNHFNFMKNNYDDVTRIEITKILNIVNQFREELVARAESRIQQGKMVFEDIPIYFTIGSEIYVGSHYEEYCGGIISNVNERRSMWGSFYQIYYNTIDNDCGFVSESVKCINISRAMFAKAMQIDKLPIRKINEVIKAGLTERGRVFRDNAIGHHHVYYTGNMLKPMGWAGDIDINSTGRIMLDVGTLKNVHPHLHNNMCRNNSSIDDAIEIIKDSDLWRCSPVLYGFSLCKKIWGKFYVSQISPIQWKDNAWDKLVLEPVDKELVRAATEFNKGGFTDIIDGKGGGTIFLLYGPPGSGKTLCVETVAEVLHRPLYSVCVGELGTDVEELEERLGNILTTAEKWDSVLLLDEADIFLEERDNNNIQRNAMVGIFLRLLEYHNGVIALTTNRAESIDEAILSRISISIAFEKHQVDERRQIWSNILEVAGITGIDLDLVSQYKLNGRQIKNIIRQGGNIARSKRKPLCTEHLVPIIERTVRFTDILSNNKHNK